MTFGEFVKNRRIAQGLSLRKFCERQGYDPSNHSKLERGVLNPPEDEKFMLQMGKALQLEKGDADWFEFHNLASIARQEIPKSLLEDSEVVEKLPVLFRTLQGERLDPEKLDELVEFIRSRQ